MLEYALQADDREMIEFERKGYEYAKEPDQQMDRITGFRSGTGGPDRPNR